MIDDLLKFREKQLEWERDIHELDNWDKLRLLEIIDSIYKITMNDIREREIVVIRSGGNS